MRCLTRAVCLRYENLMSDSKMKNPKTVTISFDVTFDSDLTDEDSVAEAFDTLIETGLSTTGILDDYGPLDVTSTSVSKLGDVHETLKRFKALLERA